MSLLPIIFRDMDRPLRMLERQMRMTEEFFPYMVDSNSFDQFSQLHHRHESIINEKEKFQAKFDLKHFTPEEITVKANQDNTLTIEAIHESTNAHGSTKRHFFRQFSLPDGHDMKRVETKLSYNGILTITAPAKTIPAIQDCIIPVTHIGADGNAIN